MQATVSEGEVGMGRALRSVLTGVGYIAVLAIVVGRIAKAVVSLGTGGSVNDGKDMLDNDRGTRSEVPVRLIVDLPKQAVDALEKLATKRETTATEILLHAISLEKQLDDALDRNARVLLEQNGELRELVVR